MSIFRRKFKKGSESLSDVTPDPTATPIPDDRISEYGLEDLPKTDPGFKNAGTMVARAISSLDRQIEEKRDVQRAARKITQTVRDMDLKWSLQTRVPKKA